VAQLRKLAAKKENEGVGLRLTGMKEEKEENEAHLEYDGGLEGVEMAAEIEHFDNDSDIERQIQDDIAFSLRSC
jgi:hypothetical protein